MTVLKSYDLNGKKLSFANWISNLSPADTPFASMTGKEQVDQTLFQWQIDILEKAGKNAFLEGEEAAIADLRSTVVVNNYTQILRKVVKVSDTANILANYGRGKELQYQMEKAGKEIKRDLEWALLNNKNSLPGSKAAARETGGFPILVAPTNIPDPDTGAIVNKNITTSLTEDDLFDMTCNLYIANSKANTIMFHPKHAEFFGSIQEKADTRKRIFENDSKFSVYVKTIVDPLGQVYNLVPNRWMPEDAVYFFNPDDFTQMILRSPTRTQLSKDGSYEKWMIEMEVGLRVRNPYCIGMLKLNTAIVSWDSTKFWNDKGFWNRDSAQL